MSTLRELTELIGSFHVKIECRKGSEVKSNGLAIIVVLVLTILGALLLLGHLPNK